LSPRRVGCSDGSGFNPYPLGSGRFLIRSRSHQKIGLGCCCGPKAHSQEPTSPRATRPTTHHPTRPDRACVGEPSSPYLTHVNTHTRVGLYIPLQSFPDFRCGIEPSLPPHTCHFIPSPCPLWTSISHSPGTRFVQVNISYSSARGDEANAPLIRHFRRP